MEGVPSGDYTQQVIGRPFAQASVSFNDKPRLRSISNQLEAISFFFFSKSLFFFYM